jgi:drug/metabolite transporter (DMT)-like permease
MALADRRDCIGGILGPVALMSGLTSTSGATASLMLNLESVLTAVLAWVVFKENADRRIVIGMLAIVAGACCWPGHRSGSLPGLDRAAVCRPGLRLLGYR